MRVLVACEESGTVRQAFVNKGHKAMSCDLFPSRLEGDHYQGDVLELLAKDKNFDLMIAFPPCDHLAVSGALHFHNKVEEQKAALEFVRALMYCGIPKIAIENPVGVISTKIRKPDQIIQPYNFGHDASKRTCLWLKNLPKLKDTGPYIKPRMVDGLPRWGNQTDSGQNKLGPSANRALIRAQTYNGIAVAMATQWS